MDENEPTKFCSFSGKVRKTVDHNIDFLWKPLYNKNDIYKKLLKLNISLSKLQIKYSYRFILCELCWFNIRFKNILIKSAFYQINFLMIF